LANLKNRKVIDQIMGGLNGFEADFHIDIYLI